MEILGYEIEFGWTFQRVIFLIAFFLLLFKLLSVSYKTLNENGNITSWPPKVSPCPDYWDLSGSNCVTTSTSNLGNLIYFKGGDMTKCWTNEGESNYHFSIPFGFINKVGKEDFAENYNIVWDGISNNAGIFLPYEQAPTKCRDEYSSNEMYTKYRRYKKIRAASTIVLYVFGIVGFFGQLFLLYLSVYKNYDYMWSGIYFVIWAMIMILVGVLGYQKKDKRIQDYNQNFNPYG